MRGLQKCPLDICPLFFSTGVMMMMMMCGCFILSRHCLYVCICVCVFYSIFWPCIEYFGSYDFRSNLHMSTVVWWFVCFILSNDCLYKYLFFVFYSIFWPCVSLIQYILTLFYFSLRLPWGTKSQQTHSELLFQPIKTLLPHPCIIISQSQTSSGPSIIYSTPLY